MVPVATEAPEFVIVAVLVANHRPAQGLALFLASSVSQWTLGMGALPLAYLAGGGGMSLPLAAREQLELGFTIALTLFVVAALVTLRPEPVDAFLIARSSSCSSSIPRRSSGSPLASSSSSSRSTSSVRADVPFLRCYERPSASGSAEQPPGVTDSRVGTGPKHGAGQRSLGALGRHDEAAEHRRARSWDTWGSAGGAEPLDPNRPGGLAALDQKRLGVLGEPRGPADVGQLGALQEGEELLSVGGPRRSRCRVGCMPACAGPGQLTDVRQHLRAAAHRHDSQQVGAAEPTSGARHRDGGDHAGPADQAERGRAHVPGEPAADRPAHLEYVAHLGHLGQELRHLAVGQLLNQELHQRVSSSEASE